MTALARRAETEVAPYTLRARLDAVLRHVSVYDCESRSSVNADDRKWLALVLVGLAARDPLGFASLTFDDTIGDLRVSVGIGVLRHLSTITQAERNFLTANALMGRWHFPG